MTSVEINSDCQQATRIWLTHAIPPKKLVKASANGEKNKKVEKQINNDSPQDTSLTQTTQENKLTVTSNTSQDNKDIPLKKVVEETTP
jgi:hypothetical protein